MDVSSYEDLGADRIKFYMTNGHTHVIYNKTGFKEFKEWFDTAIDDLIDEEKEYPDPDWEWENKNDNT